MPCPWWNTRACLSTNLHRFDEYACRGLNEYLKSDFLSLLYIIYDWSEWLSQSSQKHVRPTVKIMLNTYTYHPQPKENFLPTQTQVLVHILPKIGNKVLNSPLVFRGCIYTASLCFCDASRREMAPDGNLEAKIICRSGLGWAWIDIHFYYYCTKISKSY